MTKEKVVLKSNTIGRSVAVYTVTVKGLDGEKVVNIAEVKAYGAVGDHGKTEEDKVLKRFAKQYPGKIVTVNVEVKLFKLPFERFVEVASAEE